MKWYSSRIVSPKTKGLTTLKSSITFLISLKFILLDILLNVAFCLSLSLSWSLLNNFVELNFLSSVISLSVDLGTLAGGLGCFPFDHGAYPPQSDCLVTHRVFRVCIDLVPLSQPAPKQWLYPPAGALDATPQRISGRTS